MRHYLTNDHRHALLHKLADRETEELLGKPTNRDEVNQFLKIYDELYERYMGELSDEELYQHAFAISI